MDVPASLPESLVARDERQDLLAEVEAARGTTMAERARIMESLCRMAGELISQHPDPQRALDWQDPLPGESEDLLRRLRSRGRG